MPTQTRALKLENNRLNKEIEGLHTENAKAWAEVAALRAENTRHAEEARSLLKRANAAEAKCVRLEETVSALDAENTRLRTLVEREAANFGNDARESFKQCKACERTDERLSERYHAEGGAYLTAAMRLRAALAATSDNSANCKPETR